MTENQPKHIPASTTSAPAEAADPAAALSWGLTLTVAGGLLFALTTFSLLSESLLYSLDQLSSARFAWLRSQTTPAQVNFLKLLTLLGSDGTAAFALGLIIYNLIRKNTRQLLLLLIGVVGGEILWLLLIFAFDRTRPQAIRGFGIFDLPSYPSGHTELVVTVFVLVLYLYSQGRLSRLWGWAFAAFIFLWSLLTGAIRLFLNYHYFTDVLGGYALGLIWTGLTILLVDGYIYRTRAKTKSPGKY